MSTITGSAMADTLPANRIKVERWLLWYALLLVVLATGAWVCSLITHHPLAIRPISVFVDNKTILLRYEDLISFIEKTRHPVGNGEMIFAERPEMNYPAPAVFVYSAFANLPFDPVIGFLGLVSLAAVVSMALLGRQMVRCGIRPRTAWIFGMASLVTSYPLLFALDRGNIEVVMWILLIPATFLFVRGRYLLAAILIALAGSIKPFPLCLFVLFLYARRWKEIGAGIVTWVIVTLACFALTGPTVVRSIQAYRYGTQVYSDGIASVYRPQEMNTDHSLFALTKQAVRVALRWPRVWRLNPTLARIYIPYFVVTGLACLVYLYMLRRLPPLNQILGIFTLMVVAPPASYDYTLLYLYIPWALVILFLCCDLGNSGVATPARTIWAILVCFAVTFTAQTFMRTEWTGFGGQFKCLFMLGLIAASLLVPMRYSAFKIPGEAAGITVQEGRAAV